MEDSREKKPGILNPKEMASCVSGGAPVVQQNGIDLTLGELFELEGSDGVVRPALRELAPRSSALETPQGEYILEPGTVYEVLFAEHVCVPEDAAVTLHGRSSFVRSGVVCYAGLYDSGFSGTAGCYIVNHGRARVALKRGDRVAQIVFWNAAAATSYQGHWQEAR